MIEINLLPEELKLKTKTKKTTAGLEIISAKKAYFLYVVLLVFAIFISVHFILGVTALVKNTQLYMLNKEWKKVEPERKALESLTQEYATVSGDARAIQQLTQQRVTWADKLNKLSLGLPSGIWFNELSVTAKDLTLYGSIISLQKEEMGLVKQLIDSLKKDANFFKDFSSLELTSAQKRTIGGYDITDFVLNGSLRPK
jgi:Tfp pilus assembly protein PilN